jgi:hypothetical protein
MSLDELEAGVAQLPASDLAAFALWLEEYMADAWDRRIEADANAGKLDAAAEQANADFDLGSSRDPLHGPEVRSMLPGSRTISSLRS